jgi:HK97 family phage portal protein
MSLWKRLSAARHAFLERDQGSIDPQAATIDYYDVDGVGSSEELSRALAGGARSVSGEVVSANRLMGVAAAYAAVRVATDSVAQLPLMLNRREGGKRIADRDNPLFKLLHDRPNEWQTSFEWREIKQKDLELRGNAYSLKVLGVGGAVQELLRLHPDRVVPKQDPGTLAVSYEYTRPDGRRLTFQRREIFHVRGMGDDGIVGLSPIALHRETVGDALALRNNGSRFFSNGAKPLGVIEMQGDMQAAAQEAFRKDWESTYAGGENAHKTLLLPRGLEYKAMSISMRDAQYIEALKFSVTEIARIFRVPPHMIADLDRSTNNNIEHQGIEFVVHSMAPRLIRWEQAINRDLLEYDPSRYVVFNVAALLRGDSKTQAEALEIMRRNGVIHANKWLELMDMNPREDPGGEEYIVEANMRVQDGTNPSTETEDDN